MFRGTVLAIVWILFATSGCGSQTLFPVSGKVTHKDGTPVTAGLVIFEPASEKEPVGIGPAGEEGLAEGLALLLGRPVGLTLPEGFALLLGAGMGVVVTVEVTVAVVVSVT